MNDALSLKKVTFLEVPDPTEFRKGVESIYLIETFDFDLMVNEFNILLKAKVSDHYPPLNQFYNSLIMLCVDYFAKRQPSRARAFGESGGWFCSSKPLRGRVYKHPSCNLF